MELETHIVAAGAIVINDEDKVLLVKNPNNGWEIPGGIMNEGETLLTGLKREVKEESGVNVEIINVSGFYSRTNRKKGYNGVKEIPTVLVVDFVCKYISGELTTSSESTEVKWFSKEEALDIINHRQHPRLVQGLEYKEKLLYLAYKDNEEKEIIEIDEKCYFDRQI